MTPSRPQPLRENIGCMSGRRVGLTRAGTASGRSCTTWTLRRRCCERIRSAHPTAGLFEAADLQWWWRTPRSTDNLPQLFWFDHLGRPEAAVIATDWGDRIALDPIVMPDATPDWVAHVMERGLAHAGESGLEARRPRGRPGRRRLREVLFGHGFAIKEDGVVETWLRCSGSTGDQPAARGLSAVQSPRHDAASASHDRTKRTRRRAAPSSDVAVPP